jgi:hypothetical protein
MKKNKIIKGLGIALGVIVFLGVAGSVAMGGIVADKILHQNADKDTHDNSIKQLEVWGYDTEKFENTYEGIEVSATAEDGNTVPGTYYGNGSDKCVILVHGAGGDRVCMYPLAELYLEDGFDVIWIDQRGSGENAVWIKENLCYTTQKNRRLQLKISRWTTSLSEMAQSRCL